MMINSDYINEGLDTSACSAKNIFIQVGLYQQAVILFCFWGKGI